MIENALITALFVLFLNASTWEGMIWHKESEWLQGRFPEWVLKPIYSCPICSGFWWAIVIQLILGVEFGVGFVLTPFITGGMGVVSVLIIKIIEKLNDD